MASIVTIAVIDGDPPGADDTWLAALAQAVDMRMARLPVASGIAKRVDRHIAQSCRPWNVRFARELTEPAFAPRAVLAGKDARTLSREFLAMTQNEFSTAFKNSWVKRAKLRGLKRNAAVVLGNVGTSDDVDALTRALDDPEPLPSSSPGQAVREHAAWALACLRR